MKKGAIISDLHSGSIYGLLPPNFETFEGMTRSQNVGQRFLWDCWMDYAERINRFDPDFIIVNGDCVDGRQPKNYGSELALPAWQDQRDAAVVCLQEIKRRVRPDCKWYFTMGTSYHVGHFGAAEEDIARALGGERYASVGTGKLCREILWLRAEGVVIEAAHHISVSSGFYRLTALDREMQWSALTAKDASQGVPKVDLVVRSHVHYFSMGEHASKQGITTPCWQLQTRYMRKYSTTRMLPNIGGLRIEIDGDAKKRGEAPCKIIKEMYSLPPMIPTNLIGPDLP